MMEISIETRFFKFDIKLSKSQILGILGPSGIGKTTTLRAIAGLEDAKGKIVVDNEVWLDENISLPPQKRSVGFVFQDFALFPNMSVLDNVAYASSKEEALDILKTFNIEHLKDKRPNKLSGGERQRVAIARAIARRPKVLLMDEPFSALDRKTKHFIQDKIIEFANTYKCYTLFVAHDLGDIFKLSDLVFSVEDQRLLPKEEFEEYSLNLM
ncbi:MAG: sulfate/molybdate ABC transporter ATP-binding protein [Hydrogenobaculum sp.]